MNFNQKIAVNSKWILLGILVVLVIPMFFIAKNYGVVDKILNYFGIYTDEINEVVINSDGYQSNTPGSFSVTKKAEWKDSSTAQITFEINSIAKTEHSKDVVLVLDNSSSMKGNKLDVLKTNTIGLIDKLLSVSNNSVALINFNSDSSIVSDFSTDKEMLISYVENIEALGNNTDYYKALKNVDDVLSNYQENVDTDLVVLFLTDGYPNISNQVAQYKILKEKYPYMTLNGIQYEMGMSSVINEIKAISDYQFIADSNTLNNVLFKAVYMPKKFTKFELTDYIDDENFYIENISSISTSVGTVEFDEKENKVIWNLDSVLYSGDEEVALTIEINLLDKYISEKGYYRTNDNFVVNYKLEDDSEDMIDSKESPVLKNYRNVSFDTNMPSGCTSNIEKNDYLIFSKVNVPDYEPVCSGYSFKGWEVVEADVVELNDEIFIVPTHDVTVRAVWTKNDIVKTMSGVVSEKLTLYEQVKSDAENGRYAKVYLNNGENDIIDDSLSIQNDIYYYSGAAKNNNVIFGGYCWEIVRTTETGGVKLIYNGVPSDTGVCNNVGVDVTIGQTSYSSSWNSVGYAGYMTNDLTGYNIKSVISSFIVSSYVYHDSMSDYYFANSAIWDGKNYTLINNDGSESTIYNFSDSVKELAGYYTCFSKKSNVCKELSYIVLIGNTPYSISVSEGKFIDDLYFVFGDSYVENEDGSYTLKNLSVEYFSNWHKKSNNYSNYYFCSDFVSETCSTVYAVYSSGTSKIYYNNISSVYAYGSSFRYENGKYILDINSTTYDFLSIYNSDKTFGGNKYTCFNSYGVCENLFYIYGVSDFDDYVYYIKLENGDSIDDKLNSMLFSSDVNKNNSPLKLYIEKWYHNSMLSYSEFLEDTVYCNNRTISSYDGWKLNGKLNFSSLSFASSGLTCKNSTDRFTISTLNGNAKLLYPVGTITASEVKLAYENAERVYNKNASRYEYYYYLSDGVSFYTMSPLDFDDDNRLNSFAVNSRPESLWTGHVWGASASYYVRPVVSLKPNIEYLSGDGSVTYPYIIDVGQED